MATTALAADVREPTRAKRRRRVDWVASFALAPMTFIFVVVYLVSALWSVGLSFTPSKLIPRYQFIGFAQYSALLHDDRSHNAAHNVLVFGPLVIVISLVLGFLLAIVIDQRVRGEGLLRSLFIYPYAVSFIVTGYLWRWLLNPSYGLERFMHDIGFTSFRFDWLVDPQMVIFTLVIAFSWHASGLVMALALAGLRGIDDDIWKALRVDGVPKWRSYVSVILPMLGGTIATAVVLLSISVVKVYDLVVAMTQGGPNFASEMPSNIVMGYLFERQNVGLATAGIVIILITVIAIAAPWLYLQSRRGAAKA